MMSDPSLNLPPTVSFDGFRIVRCSELCFLRWIVTRATSRELTSIAYLNAHTYNLSHDNPEFARMLEQFTVLYPDGQAIVWAARWLGEALDGRINAADFIGDFLKACAESGLSIALIGGHEGEAKRFAHHHCRNHPDLKITLARHGYYRASEEHDWLEAIRSTDPRVVLVGMGSPRQEEFVLRAIKADTGQRVWWCVGALFEYDSGTRARASRWMRVWGLEWLFRLVLEPRRLWRRYILGNPKFILRMLGAKVRIKHR